MKPFRTCLLLFRLESTREIELAGELQRLGCIVARTDALEIAVVLMRYLSPDMVVVAASADLVGLAFALQQPGERSPCFSVDPRNLASQSARALSALAESARKAR